MRSPVVNYFRIAGDPPGNKLRVVRQLHERSGIFLLSIDGLHRIRYDCTATISRFARCFLARHLRLGWHIHNRVHVLHVPRDWSGLDLPNWWAIHIVRAWECVYRISELRHPLSRNHSAQVQTAPLLARFAARSGGFRVVCRLSGSCWSFSSLHA